MAILHFSVKPISRSSGRSSVAASAYRAGVDLRDERTGMRHDYSRRSGVEHAEIMLPEHAPRELEDRANLWSSAELAERRKDARTAREYVLALPAELGPDERLELARNFGRELNARYGVGVDLAIHSPDKAGDQRNHHAHLLTTTREIGPEGLGKKTSMELSARQLKARELPHTKQQIYELRETWTKSMNLALEHADQKARVDPRSLAAQRREALERGDLARADELHRAPTTHEGPRLTARRKLERQEGQAKQAGQELRQQGRPAAATRQEGLAARLRARANAIYDYGRSKTNDLIRTAAAQKQRVISRLARVAERVKQRAAAAERNLKTARRNFGTASNQSIGAEFNFAGAGGRAERARGNAAGAGRTLALAREENQRAAPGLQLLARQQQREQEQQRSRRPKRERSGPSLGR